MRKDESWKSFFGDNGRYADVINGVGCGGMQYVKAADLLEADTVSERKTRDLLRKTAFGMNFALIGIESQDEVDYRFPLRNLHYEVDQYEKQAAVIRREIRGRHGKMESDGKKESEEKLSPGEYMYGFRKGSKLHPVITFVIYAGKEEWDGPMCLRDILDFTDIPEELRNLTADYSINLIDIRRLKDTSVFKTDVRHVFDFIRCAEDKDALYELVTREPYYQEMDEDAFELVSLYTNSAELEILKEKEETGGKQDMCKAIRDLMEDSRMEGIEQNKMANARNLIGILSDEVIAEKIGLPLERVQEIHAEVLAEESKHNKFRCYVDR